ncbi:hypothetical protein [Halorussus halophilus]|uniref:hypothetical protein n=1 Tax=Halorussus halophilus TaxID=2650975 RepID=UPI001300FD68|nr:hypothetical protein [Halorussus halophilus]
MPERPPSADGVERRQFLSAAAIGLGVSGFAPLARGSLSGANATTTASNYVVEQGDRCVPLAALSGDEPVSEFYDYRTPFSDPSGSAYSSYGTTDLQRPETSLLFLYDGPEGLSLVVLHDKLNDGTSGGSVTFEFENLTGGEWVVGDDIYDAPSNYDQFTETDSGWQVDWTWTSGRSDGGVYSPLGEAFEVTIRPAFNEAAELYGDHYEGEITDWRVLSGDRSDPERVSLAMDEPITIRAGACGSGGTGGSDESDDSNAKGSGPVDATVRIVQDRINPRSNGRLQLALFSTETFAAGNLDASTARFGPGGARVEHVEEPDVDGDDLADVLLHFRIPETGVDWDTDQLKFTAKTDEDRQVTGCADVRLVPRGRDEDDQDGDGERDEDDQDGDGERDEDDRDSEGERDEDDHEDDDKHEEKAATDDTDDESDRGRKDGHGNGKSKGHEKGRGKGHQKGKGKGHDKGRGKGHEKNHGRGHDD